MYLNEVQCASNHTRLSWLILLKNLAHENYLIHLSQVEHLKQSAVFANLMYFAHTSNLTHLLAGHLSDELIC